ncbi:MAG: tetratricopeptide repeat protein [Halioglobus sp.]
MHWQEVSSQTSGPADAQPFREQLQALEQRHGPYADGLAEPLTSMGRYYRQQGDHERAVALYRRAMHIVRINDGLYSDRQIPLLRELLVSYREVGDLESLDQRYEYFFRLYGNGQPPFTELRVRATIEFMRWQREALRRGVGNDKRRLLDLIDLNEQLMTALQQDVEADYSWHKQAAYSQLNNLYLLLQRYTPSIQENQLLTSRDYIGNQPAVADLEAQKVDARLRSAPAMGADVLQQLASASRLQDSTEQASVQLALGDWYFWNGRKQSSVQTYLGVVKRLRDAGREDLLEQWMGEPVELPDNGAFWQPELATGENKPVIRASYDVSSRGKLSKLQTRVVEGDEDLAHNRFRRKLSATLFRPRWVSGEPEAVTGLLREYQLLD